MKLTIGYSTLVARLGNIKLPDLANYPDWDVLITVQSGNDSEPQLTKAPSGVKVLGFRGSGVTKIRNQVIENAKGDYLIFADDDVTFNPPEIAKAIEHIDKNNLALLLGQAVDETGKLRKRYPSGVRQLDKLNSAKAATYEMVVDLKKIRSAGIRFDENFGAGAPVTYLGDEYIFICDLIDAGLKAEFAPLTLAIHPKDSSGSGWGTAADRKARGLIFDRAFRGNRTMPYLARIGFGARKLGKQLSFADYIRFIFKK